MPDAIERALDAALAGGSGHIGEIAIRSFARQYFLSHRDDHARTDLRIFESAEDAIQIAKFDDAAKYRPLKTAPNLCHGWRLEVTTIQELRRALEYFYPGRPAAFAAWQNGLLSTTTLRETLDRQSGMYKIAARISDDQINDLVGHFCRSDGGCLRTIRWQRDALGTVSSTKLPPVKFDPGYDQARALGRQRSSPVGATAVLPLLCQEACNLLVSECRKVVRGSDVSPKHP
jgi:4Fe-4S iron-sulfur cluster binding domain/DR2241 stabilising domain